MSILVPINGVNYVIPTPGETGWGSNLDSFFVAIGAGTLQKTGGSFLLSSEVDFGASFGVKALYYKAETGTVATTGTLRLASTDPGIAFRNNLGSGNLVLTTNTSDQLLFNGTPIGGSGIFTANRAIVSDGSGNLTSATTTATEIGYINGVTSAIQTQLNSKAPLITPSFTGPVDITYNGPGLFALTIGGTSSNDLGASITNTSSGTSASAFLNVANGSTQMTFAQFGVNYSGSRLGIPVANFAELRGGGSGFVWDMVNGPIYIGTNGTLALTVDFSQVVSFTNPPIFSSLMANTVPYLNSSKALTSSVVTPTELGYVSGVTSSIQTQLNAKATGSIASGTAGNLTLYPSSSTSITDTYVQNTKNITIGIATQAARSVNLALTIPNPGNAVTAASIVLTEGATTINGALTLGSPLTLPSGSNTTPAINFGEANTGFYSDTSHVVKLALNGIFFASFSSSQVQFTNTANVAITSTANQLVLGGGAATITLTAPTPAASRTYTIPDAGTSASFIMTEGAATINGVKTFGSAPIFSALTANTVPYLDGSKILTSSAVTPTELGYLSGVTSAIQTQFNAKAPIVNPTFTGVVTLASGSVSAPSINFGDSATGLYRTASNQFGATLNGVKAWESVSTGTSDGVTYNPLFLRAGGGTPNAHEFITQSTTAITTAKTILTMDLNAGLVLIAGSDGAGNEFNDVILISFFSSTPSVIASQTSRGSPTARTYTSGGSGDLKLAMASGTYTARVAVMALGTR